MSAVTAPVGVGAASGSSRKATSTVSSRAVGDSRGCPDKAFGRAGARRGVARLRGRSGMAPMCTADLNLR